jgi:hypothetical protein
VRRWTRSEYVPPELVLLPAIDDSWSDELKDAIAVQNATFVTGVCPVCRAEAEQYVDLDEPERRHCVWRHDRDCPALRDGELEGGGESA